MSIKLCALFSPAFMFNFQFILFFVSTCNTCVMSMHNKKIANSIHPLLNGPELLPSSSGKAELFSEVFFQNYFPKTMTLVTNVAFHRICPLQKPDII